VHRLLFFNFTDGTQLTQHLLTHHSLTHSLTLYTLRYSKKSNVAIVVSAGGGATGSRDCGAVGLLGGRHSTDVSE
jgi:hypothetical protein